VENGEGQKNPKIIISLTSYPARIHVVHGVIESLFSQTMRVDFIFLWLAKPNFPNLLEDLPPSLLELCSRGLEIKWCDEDIKAHKKYFYTMHEYPEDIVITVDDDILYATDMVEILYKSYLKHPLAISALKTHLIKLENESLAPYSKWIHWCTVITDTPSMLLMAVGVGGVLYPPKCMHTEIFNIETLIKTCIMNDDLWLKIMQVMNNTPVVLAGKNNIADLEAFTIEDTQDDGLFHYNNVARGNDIQLRDVLAVYNAYHGITDTLFTRVNSDAIRGGGG